MSRNILTVFLYELRRNLKRKGFLFTTFGIPLIAILLLGGYQVLSNIGSPADAGTAAEGFSGPDPDGAEDSSNLFQGIERAGYVDYSGLFPAPPAELAEFLLRYEDEAAAAAAMLAGDVDVYYVIAEDFIETGAVREYVRGFSFTQISDVPISQMVYSAAGLSLFSPEGLRLRAPASFFHYNLERSEDAAQNQGANFAIAYIFSILFLFAVLGTNGYLMQSVIEEKESHLMEILLSSMRPVQLLTGKVFALGLLGLLQVFVWVGAVVLMVNMFELPDFLRDLVGSIQIAPETLPVLVAYFLLGYLFVAAGFAAIGALSASMREGPQYSAILIIPLALPYYFAFVFAETPNAALPVFLSIFPLTSPLSMIMRVTSSPVPAVEILLSLALLALMVVFMLWVAARLFRVQALLAGHMPRLRDIPKLLWA